MCYSLSEVIVELLANMKATLIVKKLVYTVASLNYLCLCTMLNKGWLMFELDFDQSLN